MSTKQFKIPKSWNLGAQQELVIGSLMDEAGMYITAEAFCHALYGEAEEGMAAPAKLRVLIQRCRGILAGRSKAKVLIYGKRNRGWMIIHRDADILRKIVAGK